jgi:FlaG/FlaF family flagellin (archaellin)
MVAITVILAAVIGAFVLDLGSNQSTNAQAGLTYDESSGEVTVNSLGDNTAYVYCNGNDPGSVSAAGSTGNSAANGVGQSFSCPSGKNVIGVTESGDENVVKEL